jgi:glutamine amidotransferase
MAREEGLEVAVELATTAEALSAADRVILPGQGAFAACRRGLDALPGMVEALEARVIRQATPFLGICVGMQLMADRGLEHGVTPGLGWIAGDIAPMDPRQPDGTALPLPQMGWNQLDLPKPGHALLAGVAPGEHAYFVHSYALSGAREEQVLARTDYGGPVVAIVGRDNLAGTQFHVEKSASVGLRILANFLRWAP